MIRILIGFILFRTIILSVGAFEITAPPVPESGNAYMPQDLSSFGDALSELITNCIYALFPDCYHAAAIGATLILIAVMVSILNQVCLSEKKMMDITGVTAASVMLVGGSSALIDLASETILELSDYGKLFFPVITSVMAAQGGVTTSASLYIGTCVFDSILSSFMTDLLVPSVYLFVALSITLAATGETTIKQIRDLIKSISAWCLKIILTVFTSYMSITGAISGSTDAAVLKATKVTISSLVPIVGGILSDASETVLVSAGLMKNAAGVYGIIACLAVFLQPFLRIALHFWVLKLAAGLCGILGDNRIATLAEDFSNAMGMLLAMTASMCILFLVSTVCFMKGVG